VWATGVARRSVSRLTAFHELARSTSYTPHAFPRFIRYPRKSLILAVVRLSTMLGFQWEQEACWKYRLLPQWI
jgi:hypothetical protein